MPRLFERFHRIEGQRGRTHEGTGIGLALVQELVRLHGGDIQRREHAGQGIGVHRDDPAGRPPICRRTASRMRARSLRTEPSRAQLFVEEALRWLPDGPTAEHAGPRRISRLIRFVGDQSFDGQSASVLIADDNADMRDYLCRLLRDRYDVEAVADGQAALEAARRRQPDLVLTDVMMPRLDGFGLLRALRATGDLPRRAGDPALGPRRRGGAASKVSRPAPTTISSSRSAPASCLARVRANLEMAVQRRETENVTRLLNETLEVQVAERTAELQAKEARLRTVFETSFTYQGLMALDGTMLDANATSLAGINASLEDVVGKPFWETPWFTGTPGMPETVRGAPNRCEWRNRAPGNSCEPARGRLAMVRFSDEPVRDAMAPSSPSCLKQSR